MLTYINVTVKSSLFQGMAYDLFSLKPLLRRWYPHPLLYWMWCESLKEWLTFKGIAQLKIILRMPLNGSSTGCVSLKWWLAHYIYIYIYIYHKSTIIPYRVRSVNKANLRDLIAVTGLVILLKFDPNHWFFSLCDLEIWCMTSKNNRAPLLYYIKLCVSFQIHLWIQTEVTIRKRSIWVEIGDFFVPYDLEIWWMTLENDRAPLLYYIKLCASFQIHRWIESEVTVQKRSIRVEIGDFLSRVTLKFDGYPWKTTGHLFYVASSFVHHFTAISEFKLE